MIFTFAAIALDDPHGVPGPLGEPGFVGGLDAGAPERDRVAQHRAAEGLRRLREVDRLARQRLDDRPAPAPSGATRLTVSVAGTAAIAAPCAAAASIARVITSADTNGRAAS